MKVGQTEVRWADHWAALTDAQLAEKLDHHLVDWKAGQ